MAGRCSPGASCRGIGHEHRGAAHRRTRGPAAHGPRLHAPGARRARRRGGDGAAPGRDPGPGAHSLHRPAAVCRPVRAGSGLSLDWWAAAPFHSRPLPGGGVSPVSRAVAQLLGTVRPDLLAWALASLRVLPVTLLCPVLGGQLVPAPVRLAVAGALALALRPLVGDVPERSIELLVRCGREAALGLLIGMGASLPFDAARIGGRLVDLVRGTSAEAALPVAGHREAATGDLLHQLLVSLAIAGGALPVLVQALARSYT